MHAERRVSCPDHAELMRFIAEEGRPDERLRIVRHLLACAECRDLAAMLARLLRHSETKKKATGGSGR